MCVISAAVIGAAAAVAGTGYSIYAGEKQRSAAADAAEAQEDAVNRMKQLSGSQWRHYKDSYKPLLKDITTKAQQGVPVQPGTGQAVATLQQGTPLQIGHLQGQLGNRGLDPGQAAGVAGRAGIATQGGLSEGQARSTARTGARNQQWEQRLGALQYGRGTPGTLMTGYSNLANSAAQQAHQYNQGLAQNVSNTVQGLGMVNDQLRR